MQIKSVGPGTQRWHSLEETIVRDQPDGELIAVRYQFGRGRRRTVSHHNKSHKGRLARLLATAPREVSDAAGVARIAQRGGLPAIRTGEHTVELAVTT